MVALVCALLALAACGDSSTGPEGRVTLTHLPVDLDRVAGLQPLGNLNVLPEDHGGFRTPPEDYGKAPTIPVYAPADGRIIELGYNWAEHLAPFGTDVGMRIRVSSTMKVTYGHMSDFTPEIWEALGERTHGFRDVDIPVTSGQLLGYVGTTGSLDWHVTDYDLRLHFENPSRYPRDWLFAGCVYDYYEEPMRSQLRAISLRSAEPLCGKIDYDVPGRIIGNWFLEGEVPPVAFDDYSTHLAIVYDEFDGVSVSISDGIAMRPGSPHAGDEIFGGARVFHVNGNAPRPEDVGMSSGIVKYEIIDRFFSISGPAGTVAGVFLVEMLAPDRIRVERFMGVRADDVQGFGANARVYVR